MFPPVFATCAASNAVKTLLGTNPVRLYPFGQAPQNPALPYAVFQTVSGAPENQLTDAPDVDTFIIQIDTFAVTATAARDVAKALRDAIEPVAYVNAWRGESKDQSTNYYTYSFDVEWMLNR